MSISNLSKLAPFIMGLLSSPMSRAGVILTIANVMGGVLGYVYQVIMGRMLGPAEFALFSSVIALIMFLTSPLQAMLMIISRQVTILVVQLNFHAFRKLYWRSILGVIAIGLALILFILIFTSDLQLLLKSPSVTVVWILLAIVFFSALFQINNAFFQGEQRFTLLASAGLAVAFLKIPLGFLGVELGYGVEGALLGIMLALAITWLIGIFAFRWRHTKPAIALQSRTKNIKLADVWLVLIANVLFAAMTQLDMVLVNWFFPSEIAGQYAAASVLGKAVLFLSAGVALSLFPMVTEKHFQDISTTHMLRQAVVLVALFSGVLAFLYWLIGPWLVNVFYGKQFVLAGELLRWYGIAIMPMALVMVLKYYLLAKRRFLFVWLFLLAVPIQMYAISLWHTDLINVVWVIGLTGIILLLIFLFCKRIIGLSHND